MAHGSGPHECRVSIGAAPQYACRERYGRWGRTGDWDGHKTGGRPHLNDAPKLLVEWSSPWQEFLTAVRPALGRSPKRLAGEARTGLLPYRGMLISWVLEAVLLAAV